MVVFAKLTQSPVLRFKSFFSFYAKIAVCLVLASCSSFSKLVDLTGGAVSGGLGKEKTLSHYHSGPKKTGRDARFAQDKSGQEYLLLKDSRFPGVTLRLNPSPGGGGSFEFTEAQVLSSSLFGWNEFTLAISGSAQFLVNGNTAILRVSGPVERLQITEGSLRLKSKRTAGEEALTLLRNRRERVLALVEWMQTQGNGETVGTQKEFAAYWKARLPDDLYDKAALLRDWEEALPWIYLAYEWDAWLASLDGAEFTKR